jgi:hypothetical protein
MIRLWRLIMLMRPYALLFFLSGLFLSGTAVAYWKSEILPIDKGGNRAVLIYYADTDRGTKSMGPALEELAKSEQIAILKTLTIHDLVKDEAFQKEVFEQLDKITPDALRAAKRSAGNMHNPKMEALHGDFSKAILATPTVAAISEALANHGLKVSRAEFEKLEFYSKGASHRFRCGLWLAIAAR